MLALLEFQGVALVRIWLPSMGYCNLQGFLDLGPLGGSACMRLLRITSPTGLHELLTCTTGKLLLVKLLALLLGSKVCLRFW